MELVKNHTWTVGRTEFPKKMCPSGQFSWWIQFPPTLVLFTLSQDSFTVCFSLLPNTFSYDRFSTSLAPVTLLDNYITQVSMLPCQYLLTHAAACKNKSISASIIYIYFEAHVGMKIT